MRENHVSRLFNDIRNSLSPAIAKILAMV